MDFGSIGQRFKQQWRVNCRTRSLLSKDRPKDYQNMQGGSSTLIPLRFPDALSFQMMKEKSKMSKN